MIGWAWQLAQIDARCLERRPVMIPGLRSRAAPHYRRRSGQATAQPSARPGEPCSSRRAVGRRRRDRATDHEARQGLVAELRASASRSSLEQHLRCTMWTPGGHVGHLLLGRCETPSSRPHPVPAHCRTCGPGGQRASGHHSVRAASCLGRPSVLSHLTSSSSADMLTSQHRAGPASSPAATVSRSSRHAGSFCLAAGCQRLRRRQNDPRSACAFTHPPLRPHAAPVAIEVIKVTKPVCHCQHSHLDLPYIHARSRNFRHARCPASRAPFGGASLSSIRHRDHHAGHNWAHRDLRQQRHR